MGWSINGVRIFVEDKLGSDKNMIARIQPLSGGTILQYFGYENRVTKLSCKVVGETDLAALRSYAKTQLTYTLLDYNDSSLGDYSIRSCDWRQMLTVCQTLRGDLASNSPVYQVELELYQ